MKTKFFLCMRPLVTETDDEEYIKPPPRSSYTAISGKTSSRRHHDLRRSKRVVPENYIGQQSIKSKGSQKAPKITTPVSETNVLESFFVEESVSSVSLISDDEVGSKKSNSGGYIMVSSLFFTMFFGKLFGILCTLMLFCSLYRHRKNDCHDSTGRLETLAANTPERGSPSPDEYKKRVIMAGLLERKSHYR